MYSRHYLEARELAKGEYYVLVLSAVLGIFVMISAGSLLTMYMGIELLALSLYALVATDRDSGVAAESAMKYFVLGAIASGCLLYGMSLVYGLSGTLLFSELAVALQGEPSLGLIMGVVFVVVGIARERAIILVHAGFHNLEDLVAADAADLDQVLAIDAAIEELEAVLKAKAGTEVLVGQVVASIEAGAAGNATFTQGAATAVGTAGVGGRTHGTELWRPPPRRLRAPAAPSPRPQQQPRCALPPADRMLG